MDGSTFYSFSQVELIGLLNTLNLSSPSNMTG